MYTKGNTQPGPTNMHACKTKYLHMEYVINWQEGKVGDLKS
jgi:hypothetical protein